MKELSAPLFHPLPAGDGGCNPIYGSRLSHRSLGIDGATLFRCIPWGGRLQPQALWGELNSAEVEAQW
ncbi:MAG: hypothetical protein D6814_00795 [Calditrichaeota bacterium]|nr:MAG: hypothetical protein D6814_00795 [Calditrichota bacterium]